MKHFLKNIVTHVKRLVRKRGKDLDQKRQMTRLVCRIPVVCEVEGKSFEAFAIDLGVRGLRLEVPTKVAPGSVLGVAYRPESGPTPPKLVAKVRWCRRRANSSVIESGLEYLETDEVLTGSWVKMLLDEVGFREEAVFDRRRSYRTDGSLRGRILTHGGGNYFGNVANLGVGGALFEVSKALSPGAPVEVEVGPAQGMDLLKLQGKVRHARRSDRDGRWLNGVAFEELDSRDTELLGRYIFLLLRDVE
ncbi:MAG: PilZ domain-containing protein [Candidatus Eremiobacteraeota bacterium]|nr:PilZ domain-containing protein [Candidatus Eremiobacteraeota bacterium]